MTGKLGQVLTWQARPRSIEDDAATGCWTNNADCFVFNKTIAQNFAKDGKLKVGITFTDVSAKQSDTESLPSYLIRERISYYASPS